jgi:hypothetical protein
MAHVLIPLIFAGALIVFVSTLRGVAGPRRRRRRGNAGFDSVSAFDASASGHDAALGQHSSLPHTIDHHPPTHGHNDFGSSHCGVDSSAGSDFGGGSCGGDFGGSHSQ